MPSVSPRSRMSRVLNGHATANDVGARGEGRHQPAGSSLGRPAKCITLKGPLSAARGGVGMSLEWFMDDPLTPRSLLQNTFMNYYFYKYYCYHACTARAEQRVSGCIQSKPLKDPDISSSFPLHWHVPWSLPPSSTRSHSSNALS